MWEGIEGLESRKFIDGKWVASKKEFAEICQVGLRTIERYIKDGMSIHSASSKKFVIIDVELGLEYKNRNVKKSKSNNIKKSQEIVIDIPLSDEDEPEEDGEPNYSKAEAKEKHFKAELAEIKFYEAEKSLVPSDDLDKALYEQAMMHKTDKDNDEKILPVLLEMKTQEEIKYLLIEHNNDRLDLLDSQIEQRFKKEPSNYDVFEVVLQLRRNKIAPKKIILAMQGMC